MQLTAGYCGHNVLCGSTKSLILLWLFYKLVPSKHNPNLAAIDELGPGLWMGVRVSGMWY